MVKHPKKKREDKKPENSDDPKKDTPSEASQPTETDESRVKSGLNKIFWLRVGLGILAGALSAEIGNPMDVTQRMIVGFGIMMVLFIVSYGIAKTFRVPLLPSDKRKLTTTGYGSYFLMFVFSWILVNTLIHPEVGVFNVR